MLASFCRLCGVVDSDSASASASASASPSDSDGASASDSDSASASASDSDSALCALFRVPVVWKSFIFRGQTNQYFVLAV